ncbi:oligopeptide/dipeptide ABC transporter ATP-binding protein [Streptomyces parvus]|uniref:ABC transporter ATP-binding protein n=1 Tax=Streptomyces parvus TaxID=66428 RepID=UPI0034415E0A
MTATDIGADPGTRPGAAPLLELRDVTRHYRTGRRFPIDSRATVHAVDGVDLTVAPGESLGVVGESGCGKSTLARVIVGLDRPTAGQVLFEGRDVSTLRGDERREWRRNVQLIFQDPYSSLDPRMSVAELIGEPFAVHDDVVPRAKRRARVQELLELVGLDPDHVDRYPHEFSGGQRQRIGIARGIALNPKLLVCDEPVSALDVSVRAQVVNLLLDLQDELGLTYVFIAHDLQIVRHLSDRVLTMYLGRVVEEGDVDTVYEAPSHPYTKALLSAAPELRAAGMRRERILLVGDPPSPIDPPSGCRFRPRCRRAAEACSTEPELLPVGGTARMSRCHFREETG